jgi:hypothetical protein
MTKRSFLAFAAIALFVTVPLRVSAQVAPFAGQGGQMPDPKAMSGMPLPVADLPAGTVTARVIRGQLSNPLEGQTVELAGAGAPGSSRSSRRSSACSSAFSVTSSSFSSRTMSIAISTRSRIIDSTSRPT